MERQSKNTIKSVLTILALVILGEGVLGLGVYWPFLLTMLGWNGVYWLALAIGVLVSVFRGLSIGLPSLFLVMVVGGLSLVTSARKEIGWLLIILGVLANTVFDLVFGFGWNFWESVFVFLAGILAMSWFERSETIKINY
jgi:hypothetical protein